MISDWMRQAAGNSIRANVEAQFLFGTVEGVGPLKVRIDERFTIEGEKLVLPHYLTKLRFHLVHEAEEHTMDKTYILEPGLKAGDRVILLSLAGGIPDSRQGRGRGRCERGEGRGMSILSLLPVIEGGGDGKKGDRTWKLEDGRAFRKIDGEDSLCQAIRLMLEVRGTGIRSIPGSMGASWRR